MLYKTFGNDWPYLLLTLGVIVLAIVVLLVYAMVIKIPILPSTIIDPNQHIQTGIGMECNDSLNCAVGLTCVPTGDKIGKCYVPLGGQCTSIYDCASGASFCDGICTSSQPGSLGTRCEITVQNYCNPPLGCFLSNEGETRCLSDIGQSCTSNSDCRNGSACRGNVCVEGKTYGEQCSTTDVCAGETICYQGYCEPPNVVPGSAGSYCFIAPSGKVGSTCSNGLVCNISTDFNLPPRVGYCSIPSQIPFNPCSKFQGCIPLSYCSEFSTCAYSIDPNRCDAGSYTCTTGFECVSDSLCVGKSLMPCVVNADCLSGLTCNSFSIYSIDNSWTNNPSPLIDPLIQPTNSASDILSSYTVNGITSFVQHPFVDSNGVNQNMFTYYTRTTPSSPYQSTNYEITYAETSGKTLSVTLTNDGRLLITTYFSSGGIATAYLIDIPSSSPIHLDYIPQYSYLDLLTNIIQAYYDVDTNHIYFLSNIGSKTCILYGTPFNPLSPDTNIVLSLIYQDNAISYFGVYVDNQASNPIDVTNVFYTIGNRLFFLQNSNLKAQFNIQYAPLSIGYSKGYKNSFSEFVMYYVSNDNKYSMIEINEGVLQEHLLPGKKSSLSIWQDNVEKHIAYFSNSSCS